MRKILVEHEPDWRPADLPIDAVGNTKPGFVCVHELENGAGKCGSDVFRLEMAFGKHGCFVTEVEAEADDMLAHYSAALDEIYRLRQVAAWEARTLAWALTYSTLPKRVRAQLEESREALAATARGAARYGDVPAETLAFALREAKALPTLTRHQWEHRNDKETN